MSEKNNGGPAFPHQMSNLAEPYTGGMTMRDAFAIAALPKCIGAENPVGSVGWQGDAAWLAYSMADAMLKAREE